MYRVTLGSQGSVLDGHQRGVHTDLHYGCPGYSNSLKSVDEEEWAGTAKGHIHAGKIEAHGISD